MSAQRDPLLLPWGWGGAPWCCCSEQPRGGQDPAGSASRKDLSDRGQHDGTRAMGKRGVRNQSLKPSLTPAFPSAGGQGSPE